MGARFAENAFFYIFTVLVLSYGSQQLGLAKPDLLNAVLLGSAAQLVFIPWFGAHSDRLGDARSTSAAPSSCCSSPSPSSSSWKPASPASSCSRWSSA